MSKDEGLSSRNSSADFIEARLSWLKERARNTSLPYPSRDELAAFHDGYKAAETVSERGLIPDGWKLLKDTTFAERSYPEHLSHENGNYHCTCCECGRTFQAHKRTVMCKVCASPSERN